MEQSADLKYGSAAAGSGVTGMNVTIEALRAFKTAAEMNNFTRAGELLYMTQPALSRLISSLEQERGVKLFERSIRRVELTNAGKLCYTKASRIIGSYDLLVSDAERLRSGLNGDLNIGVNPMIGTPVFLTEALKQLQEKYTGIRLRVQTGYSVSLIPMLERGELDCALIWSRAAVMTDSLNILPLSPSSRYVFFQKGHPLERLEYVSVRELAGVPLILMQENEKKTFTAVRSAFECCNVPLMKDAPAADIGEMLLRVSIGGVAVSSYEAASVLPESVVMRPVTELSSPEETGWHALAWRRDLQSPALEALITILGQNINSSVPSCDP